MLISGKCVTARMSISLRNGQGFHFMQRIGQKKRGFQLKKGLNVNFREMRDGKNVHFTEKRTRFLFHASNKLKNVEFRSK